MAGNRRLKIFKKCLIGAGALLVAVALLVWFLPARLALAWFGPPLHGLHLQQVDGLLWHGHAGQVTTNDGQQLGQLDWQLSRLAMVGKPTLQLKLDGPSGAVSGTMQKLPANQVEWRDVRARIDLSVMNAFAKLPQGQPRGELRVHVDQALLQASWPLQLQANAQWSNAAMHFQGGDVALGTLQLQARASNGVVSAQLDDDGHGPLAVNGQLQLSPLGWRLDVTAQARHAEPALSRWLAQFGRADANGTVHIHHNGGMAMGLPMPTPDGTPH
jgi:general secretion pathway protein N